MRKMTVRYINVPKRPYAQWELYDVQPCCRELRCHLFGGSGRLVIPYSSEASTTVQIDKTNGVRHCPFCGAPVILSDATQEEMNVHA